MMAVDLTAAAMLAAGRLKLANEDLEKRKIRLAEHDRRTRTCAEEAQRIELEIEDLHRDGADPDKLDERRDKLTQLRVRQSGLLSERDYLERLVSEARVAHAEAQARALIAEAEVKKAEAEKIIGHIWEGLKGVRLWYRELRKVGEEYRRLKDGLRDSPVEQALPTFDWIVHLHLHETVAALESVFRWLDAAEREHLNRERGRPGGIIPGAYSEDQQARRRFPVASGTTRWNRG